MFNLPEEGCITGGAGTQGFESRINSPIDYDFFVAMQSGGYGYGYRVDILEARSRFRGYDSGGKTFIKRKKQAYFFEKIRVSARCKAFTHSAAIWR